MLRESLDRLSADARLAFALLSLARFPLSESECLEFLSSHTAFARAGRRAAPTPELQDWGGVQRLMSGAARHPRRRDHGSGAFRARSNRTSKWLRSKSLPLWWRNPLDRGRWHG